MKKRSLIVACSAENNVIGKDGGIPWHLPKDMKFFKNTTMCAGICIMGRKNYESLPDEYRPLPGRRNIILTRDKSWRPKEEDWENIFVENDPWKALSLAESLPGEEICFIGGADIYKWAMENVILHKIHRTIVMAHDICGDTFFPTSSLPGLTSNYEKVLDETHLKDDKHKYSFVTETWQHANLAMMS